MRQVFKKRNSPRMQSAINRVLKHVFSFITIACSGRYRIVYHPYSSSNLGVMIFILAYGADKYDVLNSLVCVERNKIVTFCRRDIRHSFNRIKLMFDGILALVLFHLLVSLLITLCY